MTELSLGHRCFCGSFINPYSRVLSRVRVPTRAFVLTLELVFFFVPFPTGYTESRPDGAAPGKKKKNDSYVMYRFYF